MPRRASLPTNRTMSPAARHETTPAAASPARPWHQPRCRKAASRVPPNPPVCQSTSVTTSSNDDRRRDGAPFSPSCSCPICRRAMLPLHNARNTIESTPIAPDQAIRAQVSLLGGKATHYVNCDVRAELGAARTILRRLRNIEPVAVHSVAGRGNCAENIIGGHVLAARLRADAGEHHDIRIGLAGLRCSLPDETRIQLGV